MNVKDIILEKIAAAGADGLLNGDGECGCSGDDLFCCGNSMDGFLDCELAKAILKKNQCKQCARQWDCDGYELACRTNEILYIPLETKDWRNA